MNKVTLALTVTALVAGTVTAGAVYVGQHGGMHGKHAMMADPFGDATITRAEAQAKAAEMFGKLDLNRDGKLDPADRAVRIAEHFDKMDANHDGNLSKQEFIAAHEQAMAAHGDHGGLGHRGMGAAMMGHAMNEHGMMAMDANGDRTITRDEFIGGALKRFDEADVNRDGKMTKDERRAAMRAHMRERRAEMHGRMAAPVSSATGEPGSATGQPD